MGIPGKEIYRTYDEDGVIQVFDDGDRRYLSFGEDFEQSCTQKSNPSLLQHEYAKAMVLPFLFAEPKHVTLLGFGGGSLATCLITRFPNLTLDAIELRKSVIKTAFKYFQVPKTERLVVKNMDASEIFDDPDLKNPDILYSDLFTADGLDLQQLEVDYVRQCSDLLNAGGWLVLNCWVQHKKNKGTSEKLLAVLHECFSDVREVTTECGNWILLAGQHDSELSSRELNQRAKKMSQVMGFSLMPMLNQLKRLEKTKMRVE